MPTKHANHTNVGSHQKTPVCLKKSFRVLRACPDSLPVGAFRGLSSPLSSKEFLLSIYKQRGILMNTTRGLTIAVLLFVALSLRAEQADSLLLRVAELPGGAKEMTSLSFKDADLRDIFRALSQQHNLNIFVDNSIQVRTTVALRNVQVYEAMEFLCEQNNLVMDLRGGMFRISTRPTPKPEPPPPKIPMVYEAGLLTVQLKN